MQSKTNKPTHTEASILGLSKVSMFSFHYKHIKNKYCKPELLLTGKDSLIYEIETENIYQDFHSDKNNYLTSRIIHKNQIIMIRQTT